MAEREEPRGPDPQIDAFSVDVRALLDRSVANLYSHLVTRPTGRAVRLAIEKQLEELDPPSLSLVDLSSVSVLDYSCADEVVAKLLIGQREAALGSFLVLRGVGAHHREPIEAVLERHDLAVVAETDPERFELLGSGSESERWVWTRLESQRRLPARELGGLARVAGASEALEALISRRLLFQDPLHGDVHALSTLIRVPD
ncbi:MAG: hypothetical protein WD013_02775 [Gemmatimonadota bacterium]